MPIQGVILEIVKDNEGMLCYSPSFEISFIKRTMRNGHWLD